VNAPSPSPSRFRPAVHVLWLVPVAALGFVLGSLPHSAAADGLPTTLPSLPVSLPTVPSLPLPTTPTTTLPTGSTVDTGTTRTTTTTTAAPTSPAPPASDPPETKTAPAGALRLPSGAVSIPVRSVRSPAQLVLVVAMRPLTVRSATQPVRAGVQVRDTRGYLVRGATVALRSIAAGTIVPVGQKRSANDGSASFVVRVRAAAFRRGSLSLVVTASDPAEPNDVAVSRRVRLTLALRRG